MPLPPLPHPHRSFESCPDPVAVEFTFFSGLLMSVLINTGSSINPRGRAIDTSLSFDTEPLMISHWLLAVG